MTMSGPILALLGALLCTASVSARPEPRVFDSRIMGGDEAGANDTPYAASLRVDNAHVCGANIVGASKIVTAAHCIYRNGALLDPSRLTVRVGSTNQYAGGSIARIDNVTAHPDYYGLQNNLAVLTLSAPLTWTARIQPIELASGDEELPASGGIVSVAGWGHTTDGTSSYKLRELQLSLAERSVCTDAYSEGDEHTFCLAHEIREGTCFGDGGSGAVYAGKLLGISNFVVGACGSRYPDVFVRLSRYSAWLQQQLLDQS